MTRPHRILKIQCVHIYYMYRLCVEVLCYQNFGEVKERVYDKCKVPPKRVEDNSKIDLNAVQCREY